MEKFLWTSVWFDKVKVGSLISDFTCLQCQRRQQKVLSKIDWSYSIKGKAVRRINTECVSCGKINHEEHFIKPPIFVLCHNCHSSQQTSTYVHVPEKDLRALIDSI